ncbi:EG45-like domain containing protein [Alnus glutinosa]|uniref:EG45-like domain containing protein n=1 Tax=Alnus glutinosa TaxID=3517 RepID=UPI002D786F95|nr:EG45-like domain containing protein [Alnus glutinosa]
MHTVMRTLVMVGTVLWLLSLAYASKGTATFYNPPYVPSACYGYKDNGVNVAAVTNFFRVDKRSFFCGSLIWVKCIGGTNLLAPNPCTSSSVLVRVVDNCPTCQSTINLSKHAFSTIADPNAGKIKILMKFHVFA